MSPNEPTIVAVPVRNEEFHLNSCLDALVAQTSPADKIVLLLNNCTDDSRAICQTAKQFHASIQIVECQLDDHEATAGEARRRTIDHALGVAADGVVLTTDADSVVPVTWIADNLAEIANGVDCVCGMAVIDPEGCGEDRRRLAFDALRESLLLNVQDEVAAMVDPDPFDPWPRHQQHSGASIAVRASLLRRAGGVPRVVSGEDRALIARLAGLDAKIRHAPHIQVRVSGRLHGRASGGMAETMRRRLHSQDRLTDDMLEPTVDAYRRVLTRARLRRLRLGDIMDEPIDRVATDLLVPPDILSTARHAPHFGTAWDTIQRASPMLRRRRVAFLDLARETRQALALRDHLRAAKVQCRERLDWQDVRHAL